MNLRPSDHAVLVALTSAARPLSSSEVRALVAGFAPRSVHEARERLLRGGLVAKGSRPGVASRLAAVWSPTPEGLSVVGNGSAFQCRPSADAMPTQCRPSADLPPTRGKGVHSEPNDVVAGSYEETTTTTAVETTARECRPNADLMPTPPATNSHTARAELVELYRIALDLAEELGSVKAERDALRAAHRDPKPENLVAPTEAPWSSPQPVPPEKHVSEKTPSRTPATSAATTGTGTGTFTGAAAPTEASAGRVAATPHGATARASSSPAPLRPTDSTPTRSPTDLHPANSRAEIVLGPEAEDPDREEDVRAFRALIASPHASEQDVEAQLLRALGYPGRLHLAVASVEIAKAEGGNLEFPARFAWSVISGKTLPSPGSSKTWAELRSTVLPALRAEAARKAAGKTARGDSGGAHRVEHVSRPIQLNPVQQRQQEVRARQAARYLEDAKRALARQTAGGSP